MLIVIPARLDSKRYPNKPLVELNGVPLLAWTVRAAKQVPNSCVIVASGDELIHLFCKVSHIDYIDCSKSAAGREFANGTERVAWAVEHQIDYPSDLPIVNWQVDEPLVRPGDVCDMVGALWNRDEPIGTLTHALISAQRNSVLHSPNVVKAAVLESRRAVWFSRAPIETMETHVGVYAFRNLGSLLQASEAPKSFASERESLEQLRWVNLGMPIYAHMASGMPLGLNVPEDFPAVEQRLKAK